MVLQFKKRGVNDLKKVMVYGQDGSGKSTFAANYCREHGLNPVVIDVDDTNYTDLPVVDLNFKSDIATYQNIKKAVEEISKTDDFDTIILDGVTSLLEMLVSKAKGLKKYSDRAERFQDLLRGMLSSGKHLIFIGQADMEVIYNEEFQSSKMVIKINSLVNEKYLCYKKKDGFSHKVVKFRTLEQTSNKESPKGVVKSTEAGPFVAPATDDVFMTADTVSEPEDDPIRGTCQQIKIMVEKEGKLVTKSTMKSKAVKLIKEGVLAEESRPALIKYIQEHCPEEFD